MMTLPSWPDEELGNPLWCLGLTFRCTASESVGIWSVVLFYSTVAVVTTIHSFLNNGANHVTIGRRRRPSASHDSQHCDDELRMFCLLLVYFFTFAAGCLAWALRGVRYVHPVQFWPIQLLGSAILVTCSGLFVLVHFHLGKNWSPIPEKLEGQELVTTGLYRWARHPMYAVFIWAAIGSFLATLNWLIAWCVAGSVVVTLRRIPLEERDMLDLFGREYAKYCDRVPPLGFPFAGRKFWHREGSSLSTYEAIQ